MSVSIRAVLKLVNDWHPRGCKSEKDFERSLHKHLKKNLEHVKVIKQYAAGRLKGDIVVDGTILIEIKDSLSSTAQLQRLLGQMDLYAADWNGKVVVLICGDSQRDLMKDLNRKIESLKEQAGFFAEQKIFLVDRKAPEEKESRFNFLIDL